MSEAKHRCDLANEQLKRPIVALYWTGWSIIQIETDSIRKIQHHYYDLGTQEQQDAAKQMPHGSIWHSICAFVESEIKSPQGEVVLARLVNMRKISEENNFSECFTQINSN